MTFTEAAEYLKCTEKTISKLIEKGALIEEGGGVSDDSIMELTNYAETVYTVREIADILGLKSDQTVCNRIQAGEWTAIKLGRQIRVIDFDEKSARAAGSKAKAVVVPPSGMVPAAKSPETKTAARTIIERMTFEEIEVLITITKMDTAKQRLIKEFIKAYLDKKDIRKKIDDLLGLME